MNPEYIKQAIAWEKTEDYTEGLRIWKQRHGEGITYRALCNGPNEFNKAKLRTGIMDGVEVQEDQPRKIQVKADMPEAIADLKKQSFALMDERILLKEQLRSLTDPEQRKPVAFRILDITDELDGIFGKLEYWENTGRIADMEQDEEEKEQLPREYLNLRTYVSRTIKEINSTTDPRKRQSLEARLEKYKNRMKEIEISL